MGWRFQRRFKILPGVTLNASKSGLSASVGTRGAHVTVGHGKVRGTVGLPGTGISYTQASKIDGDDTEQNQDLYAERTIGALVIIALFLPVAVLIAFIVWVSVT